MRISEHGTISISARWSTTFASPRSRSWLKALSTVSDMPALATRASSARVMVRAM